MQHFFGANHKVVLVVDQMVIHHNGIGPYLQVALLCDRIEPDAGLNHLLEIRKGTIE